MIELVVPEVGESITEVLIANWLAQAGQPVELDAPVAELESDKATVELPAPAAGVLTKILKPAGEMAQVGEVIGQLDETSTASMAPPTTKEATAPAAEHSAEAGDISITPSARRILAEKGIPPEQVTGSGKHGMIMKEDAAAAGGAAKPQLATPAAPPSPPVAAAAQEEELVPMSPIRRTIARRLLESQQTTAQLTTFNEVDMSAVVELRKKYKAPFSERYGIKLGFMSFFVKAAIEALKAFPSVNAELRDEQIVYKNYYNIGIAVGGGKGLVVPVIKHAERLSFAEVEQTIADFGRRGAENKIALDELTGGTFSIRNGGVYGSMMGTPILNPPQSGILGLHKIYDRPVAVDGQVVVRPMMYLALTYDHRMVDGRESVGFLLKIKEIIEDPARLFLEI